MMQTDKEKGNRKIPVTLENAVYSAVPNRAATQRCWFTIRVSGPNRQGRKPLT